MKAFMEDFGYAILTAIVIGILIAMATPIGKQISNATRDWVDKYVLKAGEDEQNSTNSKADVIARMDDTGNISIEVPTRLKGTYLLSYEVKRDGMWSKSNAMESFTTEKAETKQFSRTQEEIRRMGCNRGDHIKFVVESSQMITVSNIIKCK